MGFKVKKEFAVIGLGTFGMSVVDTFLKYNVSVMVLDTDEEKIRKVANRVDYACTIDTTDEESLANSGIKNVDEVIVCIGSNIEGCIMTVMALKNIGVPKITVKSDNDKLTSVLSNLGIADIVAPEKEYGQMLAKRKMHQLVTDFVSMDDKHSLVQIKNETDKFHDKLLSELEFRNQFDINIVAIRRKEELIIPRANTTLKRDDVLYLIGEDKKIYEFEKYLSN